MGSDGDIMASVPDPPPPNPAARRAAIDAAMRKFDGLPETAAPREPRRRLAWATMHRRPAGAFVAAALVAVIAIPATLVGLREQPAEEAVSEQPAPGRIRLPEVRNEPGSEPLQRPADQPLADAAQPPAQPPAMGAPTAPPTAAAQPNRFAPPAAGRDARQEAPLPMTAAPAPPPPLAAAPPPPPPPSAKAQPEAYADAVAAESDNIVVTGSRMARPNLESASPATVISVTSNDFLSALRAALDAGDRRAVIRLVAIPLRVNFSGGSRTYRSSRDIERDFDRIFTPAVRGAISELSAYDLATRDGGRLRGGGRIWFGCGKPLCRDEAAIRLREITP